MKEHKLKVIDDIPYYSPVTFPASIFYRDPHNLMILDIIKCMRHARDIAYRVYANNTEITHGFWLNHPIKEVIVVACITGYKSIQIRDLEYVFLHVEDIPPVPSIFKMKCLFQILRSQGIRLKELVGSSFRFYGEINWRYTEVDVKFIERISGLQSEIEHWQLCRKNIQELSNPWKLDSLNEEDFFCEVIPDTITEIQVTHDNSADKQSDLVDITETYATYNRKKIKLLLMTRLLECSSSRISAFSLLEDYEFANAMRKIVEYQAHNQDTEDLELVKSKLLKDILMDLMEDSYIKLSKETLILEIQPLRKLYQYALKKLTFILKIRNSTSTINTAAVNKELSIDGANYSFKLLPILQVYKIALKFNVETGILHSWWIEFKTQGLAVIHMQYR